MNNKELIKAFKQGGTGNCVSIAIIKAGIEIFGLYNIFKYEWNDNICAISMRDGYDLTISSEELLIATEGSKFIALENSEVLDYANLCFTAMAKRAQEEDNDNNINMTFQEAIASLNNGELYLEGPYWIGLRQHTRNIGRRYIWQYKGVIGASRKHCFFASLGFEDDFGRIDKLGKLERLGSKWIRIDEKAIH